MKKKKLNKRYLKKEGQELQEYLAFQRRASRIESKKGYRRHPKHKGDDL
jgi:hypothetical protein